ncbi:asparagine-linked glycosylation protein [Microsporum canis]|uniref:GDP-Man:Man(3)GlcNAc(2)-PP-Dol alpha-1,2-mannosyltransferase n=1 Tax=Arthroderma otae (strain ATCC MYA-4605 / CBS 113480) TaxID=554155 RepID=C5FCL5_ARTOC|nr:alpha-1,2-mannosyltransferase alg-11 [Microsporum canis CBS 113480]EEQ27549.1 alpha-1,2-mannosyltransferase alg-11 [Microsporum canis CBS 113480]
MLSLVSSAFATLVALVALVIFTPTLAGYIVRSILQGLGYLNQKKSEARRALIRARVRVEEEDYRSRRARHAAGSKVEEEDWETVDKDGGDNGGSSSKLSGDGRNHNDWAGIVGFFHPFCNAGGGGERVLWAAIDAFQKRWPKAICAVYTGDHDVDKTTMLKNIERRFNIRLHPPTVVFLYLSTRKYVLSSTWPHFTLLGQSIGSLVLAHDAFTLLVPDIFIDTMGYAFASALSHYLFPKVPTGSYVHYPTISTDMLESLDDASGFKGLNSGAGKGWKGIVKRRYWHAFARLYGWVGSTIDVVMCNSSWTSAHIQSLWLPSRRRRGNQYQTASVVFPPVAVSDLETIIIDLKSERDIRQPAILYIAQFRPEKNHALILHAFARFLKQYKATAESRRVKDGKSSIDKDESPSSSPQLILIGSVRHQTSDETHIYNLRLLAHELRIRDNTTFLCDASWPTVIENLRKSSIGVNAMWNEHFGIGVVEYQAAGLISVVHDSGGPKQDIVVDLDDEGATGFHATTEVEFAAAFEAALALPEAEKLAMRLRARKSAQRFSGQQFETKWLCEMEKLVDLQVRRTSNI